MAGEKFHSQFWIFSSLCRQHVCFSVLLPSLCLSVIPTCVRPSFSSFCPFHLDRIASSSATKSSAQFSHPKMMRNPYRGGKSHSKVINYGGVSRACPRSSHIIPMDQATQNRGVADGDRAKRASFQAQRESKFNFSFIALFWRGRDKFSFVIQLGRNNSNWNTLWIHTWGKECRPSSFFSWNALTVRALITNH